MMSNLTPANQASAYKFIAPFLILFISVNLLPYILSFYMSFHYWFLNSEFTSENIDFVGIENYFFIFSEPHIGENLFSIFIYMILSIHILSLLFAKLITYCFKFTHVWILLAMITPYVVTSVSFSLPFINTREPNFQLIYPAIAYNDALTQIYTLTGFFTVIYYMVLKSVPHNILEAAKLEGASIVKVFILIEIPHMKKMILMMMALSIVMLIGNASGIDIIIQLLWNGKDMGLASSLTWIYIYMLLIIVFSILIFNKIKQKIKGRQL